jgi:hypothetical protein
MSLCFGWVAAQVPLDALAGVGADDASLEALAVLLHAAGLLAGTALVRFDQLVGVVEHRILPLGAEFVGVQQLGPGMGTSFLSWFRHSTQWQFLLQYCLFA